MTVNDFFELFLKELQNTPAMRGYYKFLNDKTSFEFRKAYFLQRLQYISDQIKDKNSSIWDCGCGYGTTAIGMNFNLLWYKRTNRKKNISKEF